MGIQLQLEGRDLEELLERVHAEYGDRATIVSADKVKSRRFGGLMSREGFSLTLDVADESPVLVSAPAATAASDTRGALVDLVDDDGPVMPAPLEYGREAAAARTVVLPDAVPAPRPASQWGPGITASAAAQQSLAATASSFADVMASVGAPAAPSTAEAAPGLTPTPIQSTALHTATAAEQAATLAPQTFVPAPAVAAAMSAPTVADTIVMPVVDALTYVAPVAHSLAPSAGTVTVAAGRPADFENRIVQALSTPPAPVTPTVAPTQRRSDEMLPAAPVDDDAHWTSQLEAIGVPMAVVAAAAGASGDRDAALVAALAAHLPSARLADTADSLVLIVGPDATASRTAQALRAHSPRIGAVHDVEESTVDAVLASPVDQVGGAIVLASRVDLEDTGVTARRIRDAVGATQVLAVVSATMRPTDALAYAIRVGADALAVTATAATGQPAALLEVGLPVAVIDGRPASALAWAALIAERCGWR